MSPQKRRNFSILVALAVLVVLSGFGLSARTILTSQPVATSGIGHNAAAVGAANSSAPAASQAGANTSTSPDTHIVSRPEVAHAESIPLRDIKPEPAMQGKIDPDAGRTRINPSTFNLKPQPPEAYKVQTSNPMAMPTPLGTYEGIPTRNGVLPPDSDGAVGPNNFVEWINLSFQVFDKSGNSLLGPINGNQIFSTLPGLCSTTNQGDPIVLYDQMADRWLISQFAFNSSYHPSDECIGISATGDPTGSWHLYDFQIDPNNLADYPHFGIWPDGYYMTVNLFTPSFAWVGDAQVVFDRAAMLAGTTATMQIHHILGDAEWGGMMPSDFDGTTLPPAGSPNYFVEVTDDAWYPGYTDELQFYKYHVDWANPANSTFTGPVHMPVQAFNSIACSDASYGDCVPQPGTSVRLEDSFDRVMWRLAYRNFGDHESLVLNHTVAADSTNTGHTGVRWYELRDPATTPVIYQQGTYAPDANSRWMGSAAMDANGNLAIGFSESNSSTMYPSIYYAGRLAGDPLGQLAQGEAQMFAGSGSQTYPAPNARWGDYTELTLDPTDDCTFWYINEYLPTTSAAGWHTRYGKFKFPSCSAAPTNTPTATVTTVPTHTATPVPSGTPPTATPTVTPCAISFSDVHPTDYFYDAVRYLYCAGAISGYSDGTFRPFNNTTRGQLSKIIVLAEGWTIYTTGGPHFTDVPPSNPFYQYIETAYHQGVISGYSDGTFRWGANVTRGQLSKIIVLAENWPIDLSGAPHFSDVAPGSPFYDYVETAFNHNIISGYSDGTFRPGADATRGQISKIVYLAVTNP